MIENSVYTNEFMPRPRKNLKRTPCSKLNKKERRITKLATKTVFMELQLDDSSDSDNDSIFSVDPDVNAVLHQNREYNWKDGCQLEENGTDNDTDAWEFTPASSDELNNSNRLPYMIRLKDSSKLILLQPGR